MQSVPLPMAQSKDKRQSVVEKKSVVEVVKRQKRHSGGLDRSLKPNQPETRDNESLHMKYACKRLDYPNIRLISEHGLSTLCVEYPWK